MFDIDGTLVNSSKIDETCYLEAVHIVLGIKISSDIEDYTHATDSGILYEVIRRHNIPGDKKQIFKTFRHTFYKLISESISNNPKEIQEIKGASQFINHLQTLKNVKIAFATGGWEETAKLKLRAANIDITGLPFASSSDHYKRTEIMQIAESRVLNNIPFQSKIYFGDAIWDKEASKILNYTFVLVGNRIEHEIQIDDFQKIDDILSSLDL
jgi:phosphoglycolate phosphatase-like HAD superfamily hydrolase